MSRLVCVSNRISLPRRGTAPGGLAVGVLSALENTGGLWFGWSGQVTEHPSVEPEVVARENVRFATVDLTPAQFAHYYNGYCNGALWPLFHYFTNQFHHEQRDFEAYEATNAMFARELLKLLRPGDTIWVHDYHLIALGRFLRQAGHDGPIGFFLHIPFPHAQVLRVLPSFTELVTDFCQYDLVGFQTDDDRNSFISALEHMTGGPVVEHAARVQIGNRKVRLGVYPIGVDVEGISAEAGRAVREPAVQRLVSSLLGRRLIIGVDRLDYSKGLEQRFDAFEHFLETFPDSQGKVTFLQIAPLSRTDVQAYAEIRRTLERMTGRLNGKFSEADWTPVRYLNRNFGHALLMGFLRASGVAWVTPVRDGMNLVAKEFVAAQDPQDPGVLVLSPLAGAARELTAALQVNPYDRDGMALALESALAMSLAERRERHQALLDAVRRSDIHGWYGRFLADLAETQPGRRPGASAAAATLRS